MNMSRPGISDWTNRAVAYVREGEWDRLSALLMVVEGHRKLAELLFSWATRMSQLAGPPRRLSDGRRVKALMLEPIILSDHAASSTPDDLQDMLVRVAETTCLPAEARTDALQYLETQLFGQGWPLVEALGATLAHNLATQLPDHCTPYAALSVLDWLTNAALDDNGEGDAAIPELAWLSIDLHAPDAADPNSTIIRYVNAGPLVAKDLTLLFAGALALAAPHPPGKYIRKTAGLCTETDPNTGDKTPEMHAFRLAAALHRAVTTAATTQPLATLDTDSTADISDLLTEITTHGLHYYTIYHLAFWCGYKALNRIPEE